MKIKELIELLKKYPQDYEVKVKDVLFEEEHDFEENIFEINEQEKKVKFNCY